MANYTGAEIAAVCNEAVMLSIRDYVTDHVHGAFRQRESGSKISNRGQRGVGIGILDTECPQVPRDSGAKRENDRGGKAGHS